MPIAAFPALPFAKHDPQGERDSPAQTHQAQNSLIQP